MADSSSSHQSQQTDPPPSRPPRSSRGKKSLVHANVYSLRDLLNEFGEAFPGTAHLDAHDFPSKYDQSQVDLISTLFGISFPYKAVAAEPTDRACHLKSHALCMYKEAFYAGFRLLPPPFVYRLLAEVRVCPTQLQPNAWRFINCFLVQCHKHNIEPNVSVFRYLFKLSNSPNNTDWVRISHRNLARSCFISGTSPDSLPSWKKVFFYIYMESEDWGNFFRPNFLRAIDGPVRDIKLGVDELAFVETLTGDSLHHCAQLISEESL